MTPDPQPIEVVGGPDSTRVTMAPALTEIPEAVVERGQTGVIKRGQEVVIHATNGTFIYSVQSWRPNHHYLCAFIRFKGR